MEATRHKLDEAEFFLNELEKSYLQYPVFYYYLSAFIGSARSVLWVMRSEYLEVEGWESWYQSFDLPSKERAFFHKMNEVRVQAVKKGSLPQMANIELSIPAVRVSQALERYLVDSTGKTFNITIHVNKDDDNSSVVVKDGLAMFPATIKKVWCSFVVFPFDDIIHVCKKYYALLKEIVSECEYHFGSLKTPIG